MVMFKRIILGLFLFNIIIFNAQAELTKIQKLILNEPITMMDLFVVSLNKQLESDHPRMGLILQSQNSSAEFPVETLDGENIRTVTVIEVVLDFDRGKWIIDYRMSDTGSLDKILPTQKNAQNICKAMLDEIKFVNINIIDALHQGYSKSYYSEKIKSSFVDEANNTIHRANFYVYREGAKLSMECERNYNQDWSGMDKDYQEKMNDISYKFSGHWK